MTLGLPHANSSASTGAGASGTAEGPEERRGSSGSPRRGRERTLTLTESWLSRRSIVSLLSDEAPSDSEERSRNFSGLLPPVLIALYYGIALWTCFDSVLIWAPLGLLNAHWLEENLYSNEKVQETVRFVAFSALHNAATCTLVVYLNLSFYTSLFPDSGILENPEVKRQGLHYAVVTAPFMTAVGGLAGTELAKRRFFEEKGALTSGLWTPFVLYLLFDLFYRWVGQDFRMVSFSFVLLIWIYLRCELTAFWIVEGVHCPSLRNRGLVSLPDSILNTVVQVDFFKTETPTTNATQPSDSQRNGMDPHSRNGETQELYPDLEENPVTTKGTDENSPSSREEDSDGRPTGSSNVSPPGDSTPPSRHASSSTPLPNSCLTFSVGEGVGVHIGWFLSQTWPSKASCPYRPRHVRGRRSVSSGDDPVRREPSEASEGWNGVLNSPSSSSSSSNSRGGRQGHTGRSSISITVNSPAAPGKTVADQEVALLSRGEEEKERSGGASRSPREKKEKGHGHRSVGFVSQEKKKVEGGGKHTERSKSSSSKKVSTGGGRRESDRTRREGE
uniref:Transmembrane protein n=1 Tax=Chromera velia CCMP2878 TaxID=1169474 RepID=A0A0K6S6M7_9ALVE|eukprot:Cvel_17709.t2-p1 / transcript=Cvel_17709.t2 / gene=Cvel_17709 / organism=Chromera_velia_CCMP2878 / gene_product=hypothetical protein / transcript_product=hypothetical protein / location=Cvel_scaffold1429:39413-44783(-) / protein_length=559 / sequence_SO=supercontig / SO=protein_coding / is_pseudo=false